MSTETGPNFCAECGAAISGGKFCSNCGTATGTYEAVPASAAAAETEIDPPSNGSASPPADEPATQPLPAAAAWPAGLDEPVAPPPPPPAAGRPAAPEAPKPPGRGGMSSAAKIAIAAGACVLIIGAAVAGYLLFSGSDSDSDASAGYEQSVAKVFGPVLGANQQLSDTLTSLRGTDRTQAQIAVDRAQRATTLASGGLNALPVPKGSEQFASQARQVLDRESAYLATVENVIQRPSPATASQLQTLSSNLSTAMDEAGPAVAGKTPTIDGADHLTVWAHNTASTLRKRAAAKRKAAAKRRAQARQRSQSSSGTSGSSSTPAAASATNCGSGVAAGPNTSCAFAFNVRDAYNEAPGAVATVQVYSPTTGQTYTMNCRPSGSGTTCSGGNNASVTF
jgi:hypothetical protein